MVGPVLKKYELLRTADHKRFPQMKLRQTSDVHAHAITVLTASDAHSDSDRTTP